MGYVAVWDLHFWNWGLNVTQSFVKMNPQAIAGLCGLILGIGVAVVLYYLDYDVPEGNNQVLTTGNLGSNGWYVFLQQCCIFEINWCIIIVI